MGAERESRRPLSGETAELRDGAARRRSRATALAETGVLRPDAAVARLAARQRGVVTRGQLATAGLSRNQVAHRLATGRLHRLHRGVFAVGHTALAPYGREVAALLACGPGAVLSHLTAAVLWRLIADEGGPVHVTLTGAHRRGPAGVVAHHSADGRTVRRHGLPVTTPTRTLLDLAAIASPHLERAVNEALVLRLVQPDRVLAAAVGRRGAAALRRLLGQGATPTRSEAERRLLALVGRAGLPRPETNVRLHGHEVDAVWRKQRLVVEVDGHAFHSTRQAFERDRARDQRHAAGGYRVMRVTWRQLTDRPEAVVAHLARAL